MPRYWFRPKRFGYGATPTTWEGWALTLGFGLAMAGSIIAMSRWASRSDFWAWMAWAVCVAVAVIVVVKVSRARTDGDWRWRG